MDGCNTHFTTYNQRLRNLVNYFLKYYRYFLHLTKLSGVIKMFLFVEAHQHLMKSKPTKVYLK